MKNVDLKVSVVMATYNGMKFLQEQLESIKNQTYPADEVIIFDDCSTDGTYSYIEDYIKSNELNWSVIQNKKNLGWQKNFMHGLENASNELIFLADQDDIWHPRKIEIMKKHMMRNQEIELLVCEYKKVFDDEDVCMDSSENGIGDVRKQVNNYSNVTIDYPGCTYCFRKSFFEKIKDAWVEKFPHDALIYISAWLTDSLYVCGETLHFFRRHENSASLRDVDFSICHRSERVQRMFSVVKTIKSIKEINVINQYSNDFINWLEMRYDFLANKRICIGLKILRYFKFYPSYKTWGVDMYLVLRSKFFRGEKNC